MLNVQQTLQTFKLVDFAISVGLKSCGGKYLGWEHREFSALQMCSLQEKDLHCFVAIWHSRVRLAVLLLDDPLPVTSSIPIVFQSRPHLAYTCLKAGIGLWIQQTVSERPKEEHKEPTRHQKRCPCIKHCGTRGKCVLATHRREVVRQPETDAFPHKVGV